MLIVGALPCTEQLFGKNAAAAKASWLTTATAPNAPFARPLLQSLRNRAATVGAPCVVPCAWVLIYVEIMDGSMRGQSRARRPKAQGIKRTWRGPCA